MAVASRRWSPIAAVASTSIAQVDRDARPDVADLVVAELVVAELEVVQLAPASQRIRGEGPENPLRFTVPPVFLFHRNQQLSLCLAERNDHHRPLVHR
jgi:hypothetical protein